jgi:hypothetical protein
MTLASSIPATFLNFTFDPRDNRDRLASFNRHAHFVNQAPKRHGVSEV